MTIYTSACHCGDLADATTDSDGVPSILLQRNQPAFKIDEANSFSIEMDMQVLPAQPGGFGEHPCLLLDGPLMALGVIRTNSRQATRLLQPAR